MRYAAPKLFYPVHVYIILLNHGSVRMEMFGVFLLVAKLKRFMKILNRKCNKSEMSLCV